VITRDSVKRVRTTLALDDGVLLAVKERARREKRTAGDVLSDLARAWSTLGRGGMSAPGARTSRPTGHRQVVVAERHPTVVAARPKRQQGALRDRTRCSDGIPRQRQAPPGGAAEMLSGLKVACAGGSGCSGRTAQR